LLNIPFLLLAVLLAIESGQEIVKKTCQEPQIASEYRMEPADSRFVDSNPFPSFALFGFSIGDRADAPAGQTWSLPWYGLGGTQ
jgi:hypothetical protein